MSGDLLAWLETAISAREEAARAVGWDTIETVDYLWSTKHLLLRRADESSATSELDADLATHIALNDPQSVLRRCATDRKLLELHKPVEMTGETADACAVCEVTGDYPYYPCATIRLLAEGYGWTGGDR